MPDYHEFDWQMRAIETISSLYDLSTINVRKTPFLNGGIVTNLAEFDPDYVSKNTYPNDGHDWYKIADFTGFEAFVSSKVVTIVPVADANPDKRYIIDLHPDTIIVSEEALPIVQKVLEIFCRNLLDRVNNPKPYEESDSG